MRKTGKPRGERIAAWTAVFIVHALLGWLLTRLPAPMRDAKPTDSTFDLVWIAAPSRSLPVTPHTSTRSATSKRPASISRTTPSRDPSQPPLREARDSPAAQPMSAVFIREAVERAARQAPGSFQADPFANRMARLPGRAASTFRMRPPPSLAERVAQIGKLFGGGDDPCRSVRKSIDELSQAGDSRDLQHALDYEQRFCR